MQAVDNVIRSVLKILNHQGPLRPVEISQIYYNVDEDVLEAARILEDAGYFRGEREVYRRKLADSRLEKALAAACERRYIVQMPSGKYRLTNVGQTEIKQAHQSKWEQSDYPEV